MNHYEIVRRNYSALFPQYEKLSTIYLPRHNYYHFIHISLISE